MMEHVRADLSAYLDGALPADRRSEVAQHLEACGACRGSLAEIRDTARLIAALPAAVPSRRLVPDLAPRLNWLRPLRSLSAVGAGMFLLVFMASATLDTGFRMGGGAAGTRASGGAAQPASAPNAEFAGRPSTGSPAPGVPAAPAATERSTAALQATATPKAVAADAAASPARDRTLPGPTGAQRTAVAPEPLRIGPSPWFWLALTVLSGLLAFVTHRRLRAH